MPRAQGIDVSKWEGLVDYSKAFASGASFMYAKASQWSADPRFAENWRNAKGILPRGAYHFLDWGWSEIEQAKLFVATMNGDWGELPPVLDLEMEPFAGMKAVDVSAKVWNFLKYVEKATGRIPMPYSGFYYWNQWGNLNLGWVHFPFWLAWYAPEWYVKLRSGGTGVPKPWTRWTFWQDKAKADGMAYGCQSKEVDHNWFNGTVDELRSFASVPPLPVPISPPAPVTGKYKVTAGTLKVFAGAGDMFRQLDSLTKGTEVTIGMIVAAYKEKWAYIEKPAGWVRMLWLEPV